MRLRYLHRAWKARYRDQSLEVALALALVKPGETVVDAGANKGAFTYWLRKAVGPQGKVHAFEPQPKLASYLELIRAKFGWTNVVIHSTALSDTSGTAILHVPGGGVSPGASLEAQETAGERFECQVETLDRVCSGERLAFLKVDVEGHELALFRGAAESIARDRPPILFECEARHLTKHSMRDVFRWLEQRGYRGHFIAGRKLLPILHFHEAQHQRNAGAQFWNEPDYFNNFLFHATDEAQRAIARFRK